METLIYGILPLLLIGIVLIWCILRISVIYDRRMAPRLKLAAEEAERKAKAAAENLQRETEEALSEMKECPDYGRIVMGHYSHFVTDERVPVLSAELKDIDIEEVAKRLSARLQEIRQRIGEKADRLHLNLRGADSGILTIVRTGKRTFKALVSQQLAVSEGGLSVRDW